MGPYALVFASFISQAVMVLSQRLCMDGQRVGILRRSEFSLSGHDTVRVHTQILHVMDVA